MKKPEQNFRQSADNDAAKPRAATVPSPETALRHWTFLSNHGHVLVCLASDPAARLRDVAASVGITERAVQKIVDDLAAAGVVIRERSGRRNSYRLNLNAPLRHPLEAHRSVGSLLGMVLDRNAVKRLPSV